MAENNPKKRQSRWLATLAITVVALVASVLVAEGLIRLVYPQRLYYNISQWDPDVGFTAIPNIESTARHPEYTMSIRMNSRGLRDREFSLQKPPRTFRIGVFGDSFTFGEGIQAEEAYPKILERLLNLEPQIHESDWQVEVINFGLGKTGTSHQLAWYLKEGRQYDLDLTILGFLAANDFTDNLSGVYVLRDGELIHTVEAYSSVRKIQKVVYAIPFYRWLAEHSHLVNLIRRVATGLDDRHRLEKADLISPADQNRVDEQAVDLTRRLIQEFVFQVRAKGSEFLLVNLPARGQKPLADYGPDETVKPYIGRLHELQNKLDGTNTEMLDLVPVFARLPVEPYYFVTDGHMRPAGHEVVAEQIYDHIVDQVRSITLMESP